MPFAVLGNRLQILYIKSGLVAHRAHDVRDRLTVILQFGLTLLYCFSLILICSYEVLRIRNRF